MRNLCFFIVFVFLVGANGSAMLGEKRCTWGPTFWCSNLTNAKSCHATRHCIQTVWEKQNVPVDNDSVCNICKNMVKQARDQLRSNETQEELKEVFDGSCNLIPIKVIKKECCTLADNFIPELIEALSSQMNPDQVCTVAGLCNNAQIDEQLHTFYSAALDGTLTEEIDEPLTKPPSTNTKNVEKRQFSCDNCNNIAAIITTKFNLANRDDILENILHLCGEMSSFSDACSNIVLSYFNDIYNHLKEHLDSEGICHMSGVCAGKFHTHPGNQNEPQSALISNVSDDDIPCELCEQLVKHLRDVLVANTTESEFKQVLQGLCKQTKGFKEECLSIVDQYYDVIYKTLTDELDAKGACFLIGVCPKGKNITSESEIRPLLPSFPPAKINVKVRKLLGKHEPKFTAEEINSMALPIDKLMGAANPNLLVENGELCTLCEYLLHFIQETLATPKTEDDIKKTVNDICNKMPTTMRGQCHNFIDMYGDAVIALLIQGLNPREICPKLQMCPKNKNENNDIEVFAPAEIDKNDKPTCPLCLFAVEQAKAKIKDDKSKKNIKNVLDNLCTHLPKQLNTECIDFVHTYSSELIDMLITDFSSQEICVSLKLCAKENNFLSDLGISVEEDNSSEEENAQEIVNKSDIDIMPLAPDCLLCEEVIKTAEKKIGKKKSKPEIIKTLQHSCDKLRQNIREKCHEYINRHGDKIADLIIKEMEPKVICIELGFCLWSEQESLEIDEALKYDVVTMPKMKNDRLTGMDDVNMVKEPPSCVLCEFVMTKLETELKNKTEQDEIKKTIENICKVMPKTVKKSCDKFIDQYASTIFNLIGTIPPKEICRNMQLCFSNLESVVNDEVIECGVCHGASQALLLHFKKNSNLSNIKAQDMINVACENLPAKYYKICSEMISVYGLSIKNLSKRPDFEESHICAEIGQCFENEKSNLAFAKINV